MALQIAGGVYQPKDSGIRLPGNIQLNAFGNIPKGVIAKLRAAAESGSLSHVLEKRLQLHGNRRKGAAPVQLFYGKPTGKGWEGAPMGIWRRIPPATPGALGKLVPVVVFEDTPAVYRSKFSMRDVVQTSADRRFAAHFKAEFSKAITTAR